MKASGFSVVLRVVAAGLCLAGHGVLAGTIRHDRDDQLYLDLAQSEPYVPVGQITIGDYQGSGTLVAGRWVLTAAHVVEDGSLSRFRFEVGGRFYRASEIIIHPAWNGDLAEAGDLAMVLLDSVVPGVTPAKLYPARDEVNKITTVVGFGRTGTGLTGDVFYDGQKRAGQNLIGGLGSVVGYSSSSLMADFDDPDPDATGIGVSEELEYIAAPGDSGGGWFIEDNQEHYLVGVTSFIYGVIDGVIDSSYSDVMGATRTADYLGWINPLLATAMPGDTDADGDIDDADLGTAFANYTGAVGFAGFRNAEQGDTDGDTDVDDADLGTSFAGYTGALSAGAVPTPGSLSAIVIVGLAAVRRRRR